MKFSDTPHIYKGETLTLREIHSKYEYKARVSLEVFCTRVSQGWSIWSALCVPRVPARHRIYRFDNSYMTLKQIYRKYKPDISYGQLFNRVVGLEWSIEEALKTPTKDWEKSWDMEL